ncbi:MAG: DNA repair protein RecN [Nitrospirota bacterium]
MLKELRITNFTIIDALTVDFGTGLTILTGETGAGKSIIVDAIGLLLGSKASQDLIKTGKKEAQIEASFTLAVPGRHPLLEELSIDHEDGIVLRRSIAAQGKGRAYINDTTVSLQTLAAVGSSLIDIHGQHEHQGLLKKESHCSFLDAYGELGDEVSAFSALYRDAMQIKATMTDMKARIRERGQRIEFLRFQIGEIDAAGLKEGERAAIEEERSILLNLSRLKESSEAAYAGLYEAEGSALEKLAAVVERVREMSQIDAAAGELLAALESALPLVEDAALQLRRFKDRYDIDPGRLSELDERLELIKRLERKYGEGVEAIVAYRGSAASELRTLEHIDEQLEGLEQELAAKESALAAQAETLSKKRRAAAKRMESLVMQELRELGFRKAAFAVEVKTRETVTATGGDEVEFLFSANPGEPPRPLIKVASGGELSRIMLALKCIEIRNDAGTRGNGDTERPPRRRAAAAARHAEAESSPVTLIFDEVDAGIGGATAQHVGRRLKDLASDYQVFCITHLPQIAALADSHLRVEKLIKGEKTVVVASPVAGRERQNEIARMLSGSITEGSLKHAGELLGIDKEKSRAVE